MKRKGQAALLATLVAVTLAAIALSPAAQAGSVPDDTLVCQFSGTTQDLDDIPPLPAISSEGEYGFQGPATCVHTDIDAVVGLNGDLVDDSGLRMGQIDSTGWYDDIICGTGHANGHPGGGHPSSTSVSLTGDGEDPVTEIDYDIEFTAGQGVLTFNDATTGSGGRLLKVAGRGLVGGFVNIEPIPRPNNPPGNLTQIGCVNVPVDEFDVVGAFVMALDVPGSL